MNRLKFDWACLLLGSMFFGLYLLLFEKHVMAFPQIIISLYLFICIICFAFIFEDFQKTVLKDIPSILLRLIYLGLYVLSPLYLLFILNDKKNEG